MNYAEIFEIMISETQKYLENNHLQAMILGISGGLDSTVTAAICHDIGKIKEISSFPDNDYTDEGNLLGHIYMGAEMIDVQARKIDGFPRQLLNELKHCILAHHGAMEYGSPKVPALIEATALSFADDTDAKLRRFSDLLADNDGTWTEKSDFFLGSKYRKTLI